MAQTDLLPHWLVLVAVISVGNTLQSYVTLKFTRRVYSRRTDQVTPLLSRMFGTWTVMSALVRGMAGLHIHNRE